MTSKPALRRAIAALAPGASLAGVRVLLYHAVDDPVPHDTMCLRVPRQRFREQMRLLRDDGYEVVALDRVLEGADEDQRPRVAITFDDGYRSQAWAAELLDELGFPATFFVVPRFLDGVGAPAAYWEHWDHLGWNDVASLAACGFDIGAHSETHPDLRRCADDRLDREVSEAKRRLEGALHQDVVSFSYPYGRHDTRVRQAVERAGYRLGCTSRYGTNRTVDTFSLERTEIAGTDTLRDFRWKLHGKFDWLRYWQGVRPQP